MKKEVMQGAWRGQCATEEVCRAINGAVADDFFQNSTDGKFYKLNAVAGVTEIWRGSYVKTKPDQSADVAANNPVGQLLEEAFGRGQVMWFNKPVDGSMLYAGATFIPQPVQPDANQLTPEEMQECLDAISVDHRADDFEPECPGCTARKKLAAILASKGDPK